MFIGNNKYLHYNRFFSDFYVDRKYKNMNGYYTMFLDLHTTRIEYMKYKLNDFYWVLDFSFDSHFLCNDCLYTLFQALSKNSFFTFLTSKLATKYNKLSVQFQKRLNDNAMVD